MGIKIFSELWTVKLGDWERGLIIAILTAPLTIIYTSLMATPVSLVFDWRTILGAAIAAGIAYILKNFGTGSGGKLLTNEPGPTVIASKVGPSPLQTILEEQELIKKL